MTAAIILSLAVMIAGGKKAHYNYSIQPDTTEVNRILFTLHLKCSKAACHT